MEVVVLVVFVDVVVTVMVVGVVIECVGVGCLVVVSKCWRLLRMCGHVRVPPQRPIGTLRCIILLFGVAGLTDVGG